MISIDRVALPAPVEASLKSRAAFVENVNEFAREDLIGFKRPLAATFATAGPIGLAFVAHSFGLASTVQWAASFVLMTGAGLYLVGRQIWPGLVDEYQRQSAQKRRAQADLNCGFGEASHLIQRRAPFLAAYDGGVLVFADAGDFKTLFFNVADSEDDPRWVYYLHGELNRKVWRWLRLPVSREVVRFSAQGTRAGVANRPVEISTIDAFDAIHAALDQPTDGGVLNLPLEDVVDIVERRL